MGVLHDDLHHGDGRPTARDGDLAVRDRGCRCTRRQPIGKHAHASALACGVRHDFVALEHDAEINDSARHQQQDWQRDGELDELGAAVGLPQPSKDRHDWSHSVTRTPVSMGTA